MRFQFLFNAFLTLILSSSTVQALKFDVPALGRGAPPICIRDFVSAHTLVVVNIKSSGSVGDGQVLNFNIADSVGNEYRKKRDFAGNVKVAFSALSDAAFDVCFENLLENNRGGRQTREIELEIEIGANARDWNSIQAAERLKPSEKELRRIEELADEIVREMGYLRAREERLRDTNESTNRRVRNFSIGIIIALVGFGLWQVAYLRSYFRAKHII